MSVAVFDDVQQGVLEHLRRDGIATVDFRELFGGEELWNDLQADVQEFVQDTESRLDELRARDDRKAYIVRRFPTSTRFRLDDPLFRIGLSNRVLDVVNAYRCELTELLGTDEW